MPELLLVLRRCWEFWKHSMIPMMARIWIVRLNVLFSYCSASRIEWCLRPSYIIVYSRLPYVVLTLSWARVVRQALPLRVMLSSYIRPVADFLTADLESSDLRAT